MPRPHQFFLLFSLVLCIGRPAIAQPVLDPNFVEFTASADHDALDENGLTLVQRYDFLLYAAGSGTPMRLVPLGKPQPGAGGTIRVALSAILIPLPAGGTTYEVRIAAVGPGGSSASDPSNGFSFQVTCTYNVSPTSRSIGSAGGASSFSVTAPAGCGWTAATTAAWITITAGASGTGNGSVAFSVASNPGTAARNASVSIAGQTRTVSQSGAPCTFTVSPTSQTVARTGATVNIAVTGQSGCGWSASEQSSWISIASGATGSGNGTVTLNVAANGGTQTRSATVTIAGHGVTLSQLMKTAPAAPSRMRVVR